MTLVDTSVWIDYLRRGSARLVELLESNSVLVHPFIIGELACGNLINRQQMIADLERLPRAVVASDAEVLAFIEANQLMGRGVGYINMHLLASVHLSPGAQLWSRDKKLAALVDLTPSSPLLVQQ